MSAVSCRMLQLAAAAPMARPVPSFDEVQEPVSKIARAFMGCSAPTEFQMDVLMTEASRVKKRSDYQDQDACRSSTTEEFLNKRWKRFNGENHNETKDELSILGCDGKARHTGNGECRPQGSKEPLPSLRGRSGLPTGPSLGSL